MTDTRTTVPERGRLIALWSSVLLAPAAFLVNLELGYLAVPASCAGGSALSLHMIHAGCLFVALLGTLIAWRSWNAAPADVSSEDGGPAARSRFLAGLGLAGSILFGLTIVAQWIPSFTLHPCQ